MNGSEGVLDAAQTFTVGVNGTLEQVDVMVQNKNANQPLTMRILGTTPDRIPDSTQVLSTMSLPSSLIPTLNSTFRSFVFPQSQWLPVQQGEVLAIELSVDTLSTGVYTWWGSETATYTGGGAYQDINNRNLWQLDFSSYADQSGFRTWVDTPEPSMIAPIVAAGLLFRRSPKNRPAD